MSLKACMVGSLLFALTLGVAQAEPLEAVPREEAWSAATSDGVVFLDLYAEW